MAVKAENWYLDRLIEYEEFNSDVFFSAFDRKYTFFGILFQKSNLLVEGKI